MKYLILGFLVLASGCSKHYTNKECIEEIAQSYGDQYTKLSRLDKAYFRIGASTECAKYNNDPKKTMESK